MFTRYVYNILVNLLIKIGTDNNFNLFRQLNSHNNSKKEISKFTQI